MTAKTPSRIVKETDETTLSYATIMALCAGDPKIKEKMDLDVEVARLKLLKKNFLNEGYLMENKVKNALPAELKYTEKEIAKIDADLALWQKNKPEIFTPVSIAKYVKDELNYTVYSDRKEANEALSEKIKQAMGSNKYHVGEYKGFRLYSWYNIVEREFVCEMR
jgi:hypothetical protein